MMLRAELPVQRNSTLNVRDASLGARPWLAELSRSRAASAARRCAGSAPFAGAQHPEAAAEVVPHAAAVTSTLLVADRSSGSRPACGSPPTRCPADRSPNACRTSHSSSSHPVRRATPVAAAAKCARMSASSSDGIGLQSEMIDADTAAALRDREIDARVLDHPLRVIVLAHGRIARRTGRNRSECSASRSSTPDVNVKALHADLLFLGYGQRRPRPASARRRERRRGRRLALASQQFSVR